MGVGGVLGYLHSGRRIVLLYSYQADLVRCQSLGVDDRRHHRLS
jgi:hypothetical protein